MVELAIGGHGLPLQGQDSVTVSTFAPGAMLTLRAKDGIRAVLMTLARPFSALSIMCTISPSYLAAEGVTSLKELPACTPAARLRSSG